MMDAINQGSEKKTIIGTRLKAAREALHLSEKEAASRLFLNPNIITILETEDLQQAPPATFMRGYYKSYGRLLNIPEKEINQALDQLGINVQPAAALSSIFLRNENLTDEDNRYTNWITYLVISILVILVGIWSNSHFRNPTNKMTAQRNSHAPIADGTTAPITDTAVNRTAEPILEPVSTEKNATAANAQPTTSPHATSSESTPATPASPLITPLTPTAIAPMATTGASESGTPNKPKRTKRALPEDPSGMAMQLPEPGLESSENHHQNNIHNDSNFLN